MIIKQKWKVLDNVVGLLVSFKEAKELPLPGDFLEDEGKNILVLSSKIQSGNLAKIEVLTNEVKKEKLEVIRNKPMSGKIYIEGKLHPWTIASLRYLGFEITEEVSEADLIVASKPPSNFPSKIRTIIAPCINTSTDSLMLINSFLKENAIKTKFLIHKPIKTNHQGMIIAPLIGATIKLPPNMIVYPLETDNIPICYLNSKVLATYSPEENLIILSSEALLIIYDKIFGEGNNREFIKWLMKLEIEPEVEEEKAVESTLSFGEIVVSYGDIKDSEVFNHLLYKISMYGGIVKKTVREILEAEVFLMLGSSEKTRILIKVKDGYVTIKPEKEDAILFGILRSIVMDAIRELHERKKRKERAKRILETALNLQAILLTLKDAIEAELGPEIIREQVDKIIRESLAEENFRRLAEEIRQLANQNRITTSDVNRWLEELKRLSLDLIE